MNKTASSKSLIIYADDDKDDLLLVKDALTNYSSSIDMKTFENGFEVLSYLNELTSGDETPCLIILEINMPAINGKEVLLQIRSLERYKSTPVVLFSTSSSPYDKDFAITHGAGFITKPINEKQMTLIADEFIDHCAEEVRRNLKAL